MNDVKGDPVLEGMADELHEALVSRGMDPKNPPDDENPPLDAFFGEYKRRGGNVYDDPKQAMNSLIEMVKARG